MSDEVAKVGIGITADNRTEPGAKAAERRLAQMAKRTSGAIGNASNENERASKKMSAGMIGSFAKIEQAAARALGTGSMTSGIGSRFKAVGEAASVMGNGLAGAATEGVGLAGSLGIVATASAAVAGVALAAAYAGYKLADGWAKSAAQIGRTSDIIGVSTRTLQEFSAAAERVGVDKGTAEGALGNVSQTLNDARYGRNPGAMAALSRLGVGLKMNKDGTVDVDAMLPAIASAIARQNSSGRRTAASLLGIPLAALPAFSQGGGALSADMKDAAKTSAIVTDGDVSKAKGFVRKEVQLGQLKDKVTNAAGAGAAALGEPVLDKLLKGALWVNNGGSLISVAGKAIGDAGAAIGKAAGEMAQAAGNIMVWGHPSDVPQAGDGSLYARIENAEHSRQDQVSPKGAFGVMQLMPNTARQMASELGIPYDDAQAHNNVRYNRMLGQHYIDDLWKRYNGDETLISAAYNAGIGRVSEWTKAFGDPSKHQISDAAFADHIPSRFRETRDYVHKVVVEFKNAPKGTVATTHGPGGISQSLAH